jgi:hypothetical protein
LRNTKEYQNQWYKKHPEYFKTPERLKYKSEYYYNRYRSTKDKLFDILGRQCSICGFNDIRALQIDHINGGGVKQGRSYYKHINDPDIKLKLQVLCANCNWIKRAENNENKSNTSFDVI